MNPRNRLPSLDLLKAFESAARHLSFTKAAAELFVTQSAMSRQIRQLEEHLGVRLFERRTRAVVLTDVGYRYYTELAPLLQQIGALTQNVTAAHSARRVRVTATLTFSSLWLVPRLAQFQERHPHVHVHVVADNAVRDIVRDDFDLAVRYTSAADAGPGALKLFDERLTPVCSPRLVARGAFQSLVDLDKHVLIHFNDLEGRAPWLSWEHLFAAAKHPGVRGKGTVHFSHYDQAIRAAREAQGIALGRLPVIDALLADGGLVAPLRNGSAITLPDRGYWLVVREQRQSAEEVALFMTWLREEAERSAAADSRRQQSLRTAP